MKFILNENDDKNNDIEFIEDEEGNLWYSDGKHRHMLSPEEAAQYKSEAEDEEILKDMESQDGFDLEAELEKEEQEQEEAERKFLDKLS